MHLFSQVTKVTQKSMLMCVPVPEADAPKFKRERRLVSEQDSGIVNKTVRIWPVERPETEPVDEMWGRSKVACVESKAGMSMVMQQSLSDDTRVSGLLLPGQRFAGSEWVTHDCAWKGVMDAGLVYYKTRLVDSRDDDCYADNQLKMERLLAKNEAFGYKLSSSTMIHHRILGQSVMHPKASPVSNHQHSCHPVALLEHFARFRCSRHRHRGHPE